MPLAVEALKLTCQVLGLLTRSVFMLEERPRTLRLGVVYRLAHPRHGPRFLIARSPGYPLCGLLALDCELLSVLHLLITENKLTI